MHPASVNKPNFIILQYTPVHTHDKGGKEKEGEGEREREREKSIW